MFLLKRKFIKYMSIKIIFLPKLVAMHLHARQVHPQIPVAHFLSSVHLSPIFT
jgi:hypothetical protein